MGIDVLAKGLNVPRAAKLVQDVRRRCWVDLRPFVPKHFGRHHFQFHVVDGVVELALPVEPGLGTRPGAKATDHGPPARVGKFGRDTRGHAFKGKRAPPARNVGLLGPLAVAPQQGLLVQYKILLCHCFVRKKCVRVGCLNSVENMVGRVFNT